MRELRVKKHCDQNRMSIFDKKVQVEMKLLFLLAEQELTGLGNAELNNRITRQTKILNELNAKMRLLQALKITQI
jgi:hypothetical protein